MSLKRSTCVHDLTSIPTTLNFELNVTLSLKFLNTAIPVMLESLKSLKQTKFSLRHLLPVEYDDAALVWSIEPSLGTSMGRLLTPDNDLDPVYELIQPGETLVVDLAVTRTSLIA